jgi:cyclophilin family peptidyl-prolyl cis-trans isomerase
MRSRIAGSLTFLVLTLAACSGTGPRNAEAPKPPTEPPDVYRVQFETTKGAFVVEVRRAWAPRGADHFYDLVTSNFYNGSRFHRVLYDFIAQFGVHADPKINAIWNTATIPDDPAPSAPEASNRRGTVSFAKIGLNSRTTEVFINLKDNPDLDKQGFVPFGEVVEGMDVVDKLDSVYGELAPKGSGPNGARLATEGERYLATDFRRLDKILSAKVLLP